MIELRWFTSNKSKKEFQLPESSGKATQWLKSVMGHWWSAHPVKSTICGLSLTGWRALRCLSGRFHLAGTVGWSVSIQEWQRKLICVSIFVRCRVLLYMDTWGAVEDIGRCWFAVLQPQVYYKAPWHKNMWNEMLFFSPFYRQPGALVEYDE